MSSSCGGHFHHLVTWQSRVSSSTNINADKLAEFFVEKVEGVRAAAVAVVCSPWRSAALQLPWSFYWGSAARADAFACPVKSCSRLATNVHPTWAGRRHTNGPWRIKFKIVLMAVDCIVDSVQPMYVCAPVKTASTYHSRQALTPVLVLVDSGLHSNCNRPEVAKDAGWSLEITVLRTPCEKFLATPLNLGW